MIDPITSAILLTDGEGWLRSQDGGSSWHRLLEARFARIAIDSATGRYFAAVQEERGQKFAILESTNGGRSWSDLPDLDQAIFSLAIGQGRGVLVAATDGGVFELPFSGRAKVRKR